MCAARYRNSSLPGHFFCSRQCCFNTVWNEDECCATLHSNRVSPIFRQDKDRSMEGWIISPPALPVGAPSLFFWAKHVAPHNERTRILQCIQFSLVFFWLIEHPVVEYIFRDVPKRFFKTLVGSCNESI